MIKKEILIHGTSAFFFFHCCSFLSLPFCIWPLWIVRGSFIFVYRKFFEQFVTNPCLIVLWPKRGYFMQSYSREWDWIANMYTFPNRHLNFKSACIQIPSKQKSFETFTSWGTRLGDGAPADLPEGSRGSDLTRKMAHNEAKMHMSWCDFRLYRP